jgi:hypothetical protein
MLLLLELCISDVSSKKVLKCPELGSRSHTCPTISALFSTSPSVSATNTLVTHAPLVPEEIQVSCMFLLLVPTTLHLDAPHTLQQNLQHDVCGDFMQQRVCAEVVTRDKRAEVPKKGDIVTGRSTRIQRDKCTVEILCVGDQKLSSTFQGVIQSADVRETADKARFEFSCTRNKSSPAIFELTTWHADVWCTPVTCPGAPHTQHIALHTCPAQLIVATNLLGASIPNVWNDFCHAAFHCWVPITTLVPCVRCVKTIQVSGLLGPHPTQSIHGPSLESTCIALKPL